MQESFRRSMTEAQQRQAAKHFAEYWAGKGYEKGESQKFWLSLLGEVYGVEHPAEFISFEDQVHLDHTSFIDGHIRATRVLIEQKSLGKNLLEKIKQSDGSFLTPFQQAKRYITELPVDEHPKWVITCNFEKFLVYDMNRPNGEPEEILLKNLPTEYYRLNFLTDTGSTALQKEMQISIQAGELVGKLYDAFLKQYKDPSNPESLRSLNALCVRLVFCLYAEDAGIFGKHLMFHDYMQHRGLANARQALIDLFRVLDQRPVDRDPYLDDELAAFPYVNGGLFKDENIEIPRLNEEIFDLILNKASADFDWRDISPTIFGAVFESTLNPETRRKGGMHYTSIENIHKVIDPLFLDDLKAELEAIKAEPVQRTRTNKLKAYHDKLASLTFLDPAAGSGNFLTETYICLRRLENEVISLLYGGQITFGDAINPIQVNISQFYGIEINDFAVTVAKTALWIAESQMMKETEDVVHMTLDFLPLKTNAHIHEGNALRLDWEEIVPKDKLNYIMGNPPFVGGMMTNSAQKEDMQAVFGDIKGLGELDYVSAWYQKATKYMMNTSVHAAFVSTNSICQGQQATTLWKPLFEQGVIINFAYRTFVWNSEAKDTAHVHCVIIGFSLIDDISVKKIYIGNEYKFVSTINSYLNDAPIVFIENRSKPICDVPPIKFGNMPRDGGNFILSDEEKELLEQKEPLSKKWIRPYLGATEFINNKSRWCLWLVGANPTDLRQCPTIMQRVEKVKEFRENSVASGTRKFAATPTLFCQIAQTEHDYIAVPKTSSERRKYIPMGFLPYTTIASDLLFMIPNADIYHFGILTSNVHNAWMRVVCGRLKSDYRYAKDIVYNNFPWPTPTDAQKAKIEQTAQAILDARALYPDSSLADLYDELTMPPELRTAHQQNDKAVMEAYGLPVKGTTESSCVAHLMKLYQELTAEKKA